MFASSKSWGDTGIHSMTMSLFIVGTHLAYQEMNYRARYDTDISCIRGDLIFIVYQESNYLGIHISKTLKHFTSIQVPGAGSDDSLNHITCGDGNILYMVMKRQVNG